MDAIHAERRVQSSLCLAKTKTKQKRDEFGKKVICSIAREDCPEFASDFTVATGGTKMPLRSSLTDLGLLSQLRRNRTGTTLGSSFTDCWRQSK